MLRKKNLPKRAFYTCLRFRKNLYCTGSVLVGRTNKSRPSKQLYRTLFFANTYTQFDLTKLRIKIIKRPKKALVARFSRRVPIPQDKFYYIPNTRQELHSTCAVKYCPFLVHFITMLHQRQCFVYRLALKINWQQWCEVLNFLSHYCFLQALKIQKWVILSVCLLSLRT